MNHEELETLLGRHPDLAPSPDLEARIVKAAARRKACRRPWAGMVPAAAGLIFCVGVVGSVLSTIGGKGKPEVPLVVRFLQEDLRWVVQPADIFSQLPHAKERGVVFVGPDATPWGLVQGIRKACDQAGIPKTEWRAGERIVKVYARGPVQTGQPDTVRLEDIRVILRRPPGSEATVRRVGDRKPVKSDDELMGLILGMMADYEKAGKAVIPVFIDAGDNLPWSEIVALMEQCRAAGILTIDLDPPTDPRKFDRTHFGPDQRRYPRND